MRIDGVDAAVLYPGVSTRLDEMTDPALAAACMTAYNDWLLREFCAADPRRLSGVCLVSLRGGLPAMCAEVERVARAGAGGVLLPCSASPPLWDACYDPLWQCASQCDLVVSLDSRKRPGAAREGASGSHLEARLEVATTALHGFAAVETLTHMIFGRVFERFPALKLVIAGSNVGWVPAWFQAMRHAICGAAPAIWRSDPPPRLERYLGRNLHFTAADDFVGFPLLASAVQLASATLYATNYGSSESTWPRSSQLIPELTQTLSERSKAAVLAGNATRLYHFDLEPAARWPAPN